MNLKDKIKATKHRRQAVALSMCPELDGELWVRKLSHNEREALRSDNIAKESWHLEFLAKALVDSEGMQLCSDAAEVGRLLADELDDDILEAICNQAIDFCIPTPKSREGMEKNSESGRSGDSPSGSAGPLDVPTPISSETSLPPNSSTSGTLTVTSTPGEKSETICEPVSSQAPSSLPT